MAQTMMIMPAGGGLLNALDAASCGRFTRGNFVVCAGPTGSGKTILASQLSTELALQSRKCLFVSTEATFDELQKRSFSAHARISFDRIKDGVKMFDLADGFSIPDPDQYGENEAVRAAELIQAWRASCTYMMLEPSGFAPDEDLLRKFDEYVRKHGIPFALIYDYLRFPRVKGPELDDPFRMRAAVEGLAEALRNLSHDRNILVIAFCQAHVTKGDAETIGPENISEFPKIAGLADVVVGISQTYGSDSELDADNSPYRLEQTLSVYRGKAPTPVILPVLRNFEYQRFDLAPEKKRGTTTTEFSEWEVKKAEEIERLSEFKGYVLGRRQTLLDAFQCGHPYAANVYAFLLLAAKHNGRQAGQSFWPRDKMGGKLGLSPKQLRTATDYLENSALVTSCPGSGRSLVYTIGGWSSEQDPSKGSFFKLFKNLRDSPRADLLGDPDLFRTLLYVLCHARGQPAENSNPPGEGELLLQPTRAQETLNMDPSIFEQCLATLENRGTIAVRQEEIPILTVRNWFVYQKLVCPPTFAERSLPAGGLTANDRRVKGKSKAAARQTRGN